MVKQLTVISIVAAIAAPAFAAGPELPALSAGVVRSLPFEPPALAPQPAQVKTLTLVSAEGAEISIDYETAVVQEDWAGKDIGAKNVSVIVRDGSLRGADKVNVALKEWVKTHTGQIVGKTHKLGLEYGGAGIFKGTIPGHVMLYSDYSGDYYHNLVVTVNGKRLHGTDNKDSFKVEFVHGYRAVSPEAGAKRLQAELRKRGVNAKVKAVTVPGQRTTLAVEFSNWDEYELVQDMFEYDADNNPVYMGFPVSPRVPKIPQYAKDAFKDLKECSIADAMFIRQPSLGESVDMLKPCMKAVSKRYGVPVSAQEGKVPATADAGIGIYVRGELMIGNAVLMDLNYSIKLRHGGLFGHKAYVEYRK